VNGKNSKLKESGASGHRGERWGEGARILLAEDDDYMRSMLALMLMEEGYEVTECRDGLELMERLHGDESSSIRRSVDLVITDIRMPAVTGMEVLEGLSPSPASPPVILITAFGDEKTVEKALRLGAAAVLSKPFEMEELKSKVDDILDPECRDGKPSGRG
jgi:two-component system response regulator (stage 0 sporulation protein F)